VTATDERSPDWERAARTLPSLALTRRLARSIERAEPALLDRWTKRHLLVDVIRQGISGESPADAGASYRDTYLRPLVRLLTGYLRTQSEDYAEVYADERMRFVAFGTPTDAVKPLRATIAEDESDLFELVAAEEELEQAMSAVLHRLHDGLLQPTPGRRLRMTLVGDCLMTEVRAFIAAQARREAIALETTHFYFSARQGIGLVTEEVVRHLEESDTDLLALSFLTFEGIPPYQALLARADHFTELELSRQTAAIVSLMHGYLEQLRHVTAAPFLIHGACGLPLSRYRRRLRPLPALSRGRRRVLSQLNEEIRELALNTENAVFIDEARVCAEHGLRRAGETRFPRDLIDGAMFHTSRLGGYLAPDYLAIVTAYLDLHQTKVLLVDFDNTLWDGVMADGPVVHHRDRQLLLKQLMEAGLLLVAVSKNTPDSIRWKEMELAERDFVLHKVGWNQKAQSIEEAAHQLDLAPSSFVLIDDNPAERELVCGHLPEVLALDPGDPATWRALEWMIEFPNTRRTAEASRRTEMYREAAKRRESLSVQLDYDTMMSSLALRATFDHAQHRDLDRIHELVARTNQFNTTTRRYTLPELQAMLSDDRHGIYVASLADKFGNLGLVGVVVVERSDGDIVFRAVVMSCRAMGFGLEHLMLRRTLDAESPWVRAVGLYVPSERNNPCADLFTGAGFAESGDHEWVLEPHRELPSVPPWLAVAA
jgi:FkbH-like protein